MSAWQTLDHDQLKHMVKFYRKRYRDAKVVSITALNPGPSPNFISNFADFINILLSMTVASAHQGLSRMHQIQSSSWISMPLATLVRCSQSFRISKQKIEDMTTLLEVYWFEKSTEADTSVWDPFPELEVFFWKHNSFLDPYKAGPPRFITTDDSGLPWFKQGRHRHLISTVQQMNLFLDPPVIIVLVLIVHHQVTIISSFITHVICCLIKA
ncbi:hypothetical protein EV702DRAFT_1196139 [Suillus placidus]|uniref:Uncharacterized protein n=1 Tax=Suillus placidus TaxID=48579 RepID=A0A9P6ZXY1_9AGAM|nr:hypothetical protein EV702DRAFT_1196139 [Suillus placidus]